MSTPKPTAERIVWGPWWRAAFIIVGLLGAIAVAFAIWMNSEADLRAVERRAKTEGIPLTWKELGRTQSPPEILVRWNELMELAKRCQPWQYHAREPKDPYWSPSWIGEPLPESFVTYHAGLDAESLVRIDTLLGQLGDAPVHHVAEPTIDGSASDLTPMRDLTRLLAERIVLAPADNVGPDCARLLSWTDRGDPALLLHDLVAMSIRAIALPAIVNRQEAIRVSPEREAILGWLDRHSADLTDSFAFTLNGELCAQLKFMHAVVQPEKLPDIDGHLPIWLRRPVNRIGRRMILDDELDFLLYLRDKPSIAAIITESVRREKLCGPSWDPREYLRKNIVVPFGSLMKQHIRDVINCRLVASYLRSEPLPIDPCDPAGGAMRPIIRNDVMIGAYSIGFDHVDNGGDKTKDFCFALTARLGTPKAADPLPVPKP